MVVRKFFINIVILILYIVVALPLINIYLMPSIINWIVNHGDKFLVFNFTTIEYVFNKTTNNYTAVPKIITYDLRHFIILLIQIAVYVIVPIILIFSLRR